MNTLTLLSIHNRLFFLKKETETKREIYIYIYISELTIIWDWTTNDALIHDTSCNESTNEFTFAFEQHGIDTEFGLFQWQPAVVVTIVEQVHPRLEHCKPRQCCRRPTMSIDKRFLSESILQRYCEFERISIICYWLIDWLIVVDDIVVNIRSINCIEWTRISCSTQ